MKFETIEIPQHIIFKVYGVNTIEELEAAQAEEKKYWCAGHPGHNTDVYFVPDGINKECEKHHYRCTKCDKIAQIG